MVAAVSGGSPRLRRHPQVRPLHLCPRHARGGSRCSCSRCPSGCPLPLTGLEISSRSTSARTLPRLPWGARDPSGARPDESRARPPRRRKRRAEADAAAPGSFLGSISAGLVIGQVYVSFYRAAGAPAGQGAPRHRGLHNLCLEATTMTFLGIVAWQVGTTSPRAPRRRVAAVGRRLQRTRCCSGGSRTEVVFVAAIVYVPRSCRTSSRRPPSARPRSRSSRHFRSSSGEQTRCGAPSLAGRQRESHPRRAVLGGDTGFPPSDRGSCRCRPSSGLRP